MQQGLAGALGAHLSQAGFALGAQQQVQSGAHFPGAQTSQMHSEPQHSQPFLASAFGAQQQVQSGAHLPGAQVSQMHSAPQQSQPFGAALGVQQPQFFSGVQAQASPHVHVGQHPPCAGVWALTKMAEAATIRNNVNFFIVC